MSAQPEHDIVSDVRTGDRVVNLLSQYVATFYRHVMKGQVRADSPDTRIKYSRDWEYPWALVQSEVRGGERVLDCGAGYSPLIFIWAELGAQVYAVDRDALICSKLQYAARCARSIVTFPIRLVVRPERRKTIRTDAQKLGQELGRLWRADFWGPIPPRLLARYGVTYLTGPAADFTRLSYADESFDVVSCISVLEHMPPDAQMAGLREMARVLKPGGRLIITYDKIVDLTAAIITTSRLHARAIVEFRPTGVYQKKPDVVGICLIKPRGQLES